MKNLGFGMMRLPDIDGNPTNFNYEELNKMVDAFLEAGYNYFDTSYVYHKGKGDGLFLSEHLFDHARGWKEAGKIKHLGISFHSSPALLDRVLDTHPEIEFVQIALNPIDWDSLIRPALMTTTTSRISWLRFHILISTASFRIRKSSELTA